MNAQEALASHFARLAEAYNDLRTTDPEPIEYVRQSLDALFNIRAADIGCGAGRYAAIFLRALPPRPWRRLSLLCVDPSAGMLAQAKALMADDARVQFVQTDSADFLGAVSPALDAIMCFNAVHHIGFRELLAQASHALKEGGHLFVYTRTRTQNSGSVWGRFFPSFAARETRLYERAEMVEWAQLDGDYGQEVFVPFTYEREAEIGRLLALAKAKHYSTFSLYTAGELEAAISGFEANLRREFSDTGRIAWQDGNLMVHLRRL